MQIAFIVPRVGPGPSHNWGWLPFRFSAFPAFLARCQSGREWHDRFETDKVPLLDDRKD